MRLVKLALDNFQGARDLRLDAPNGVSLSVRGTNATGKTTLKNAYLWLLTGKDAQGRADFAVKPRDKDGNEKHNLETVVSASFDTGLSLKKVLTEKWTKQRGHSERVYEGNEIAYYIDGVPVKKKDYDAKVSEIADETTFRVLSDTSHFCEGLHWTERRKMLARIAGVDMSRVAEIETVKAKLAASKKELQKDIDTLPTRIDEATKAVMPEKIDMDGLLNQKVLAQEEIEKAQARIADIKNGGAVVELRRKIADAEDRLKALERADLDAFTERNRKANADLLLRRENHHAIESKGKQASATILTLKHQREIWEKEIVTLRKDYETVAATEWKGATACNICGAAIAPDKIEAAISKFNADKAAKMLTIEADGVARAENIKNLDAEIEAATRVAVGYVDEAKALLDDIAVLPIPEKYTGLKKEGEVKELLDMLVQMREETRDIERMNLSALQDATAILVKARESATSIDAVFAKVAASQKQEERVKELQGQQKALGQRYADIERELMAIETEQKAMAEEIGRKVNAMFSKVEFALFKEQINGGIVEVCEPMIGGVPYGSANRAAQINAGLDIIAAIGKALNKNLPVWIDNREAVVVLNRPADVQTIELIVDEKYPTINIQEA